MIDLARLATFVITPIGSGCLAPPSIAAASPPAVHAAALEEVAPPVEVWKLDQLRVPRDTDPAKLKALEPDHSLAAVMARLKKLGVPFTRHQAAMLPGSLPADLQAQIAAQPPGEPFILPERDFVSINVIVGRRLPPGTVRWLPPVPRRHAPAEA